MNFIKGLINKNKPILHKIRKKKFHNSSIDSLISQVVEAGENIVSGPAQ